MTTKRVDAESFLEELTGGPLTFGRFMASIRLSDDLTQAIFAKKLGISRQNLCDIEKDRASVSPARAARWAKQLGHSEHLLVALALQSLVDAAGLALRVSVAARRRGKAGPKKPRAA